MCMGIVVCVFDWVVEVFEILDYLIGEGFEIVLMEVGRMM